MTESPVSPRQYTVPFECDMRGVSRRVLAVLLDESETSDRKSSKAYLNSESSDDNWEVVVYKRALDDMLRLPARRPKVIGFIECSVHCYSDGKVAGGLQN